MDAWDSCNFFAEQPLLISPLEEDILLMGVSFLKDAGVNRIVWGVKTLSKNVGTWWCIYQLWSVVGLFYVHHVDALYYKEDDNCFELNVLLKATLRMIRFYSAMVESLDNESY